MLNRTAEQNTSRHLFLPIHQKLKCKTQSLILLSWLFVAFHSSAIERWSSEQLIPTMIRKLPEMGVVAINASPVNIQDDVPFIGIIRLKLSELKTKNISILADESDPEANKKMAYYHQITGAPGLCLFSEDGKSARISLSLEILFAGLKEPNDKFENAWFTLLHEINNAGKRDKFGFLEEALRKGAISRDDFIDKYVSLEVDSMLTAIKELEDGLRQIRQKHPSVSFGYIDKQYGKLKSMKYFDIISYYINSRLGFYYGEYYDNKRGRYNSGSP